MPRTKQPAFSKWELIESAAFGRFEADDRAGNDAYKQYANQMKRDHPDCSVRVFWRAVRAGGVHERVAVVVTRRKPQPEV